MIVAQDLRKRFKKVQAVDGVSFEARAGEVFGLLGPNGAGKTTTLRLIASSLTPDTGTAIIAGHDVRTSPSLVRKNIGVLTASIGVYGRLTARENLRYFARLYGLDGPEVERRIEELIDYFEMKEFADRRAEPFSTGMKQKLAIARAIVHDPPVIIFDEPTSGLDVLASRIVVEFVRRAKTQGKCVILSTHHLWEAEKLCDRAAIIHEGRVKGYGTVAEIMQGTRSADLEEAFLKLVNVNGSLAEKKWPTEVRRKG